MDEPYRLHVKLGPAEFNGEGPEASVKEAYEQFLKAMAAFQPFVPTPAPNTPQKDSAPQELSKADEKLLERAFIREGDRLILRHLPSADRPNRAAETAIMLLYGFKKLLATEDVLVTRLNESLRASGINMERIDRSLAVHSALYRKGGTRSGGRYTLNNQGDLQAEQWLRELFN